MKFTVFFEDKELEIENDSAVSVKQLLSFLRENLNLNKDVALKLTDNQEYLNDEVILKEDNVKKTYYLVALDNFFVGPSYTYNEKIEDLIANVTEAPSKMIIEDKGKSTVSLDGLSLDLNGILQLINFESGNTSPELKAQILNLLRNNLVPESDRMSQLESNQSLPMINISPNTEFLKQLGDMGYSDERCRKVLIHTNNDINAAIELLISEQDLYLPDCKFDYLKKHLDDQINLTARSSQRDFDSARESNMESARESARDYGNYPQHPHTSR